MTWSFAQLAARADCAGRREVGGPGPRLSDRTDEAGSRGRGPAGAGWPGWTLGKLATGRDAARRPRLGRGRADLVGGRAGRSGSSMLVAWLSPWSGGRRRVRHGSVRRAATSGRVAHREVSRVGSPRPGRVSRAPAARRGRGVRGRSGRAGADGGLARDRPLAERGAPGRTGQRGQHVRPTAPAGATTPVAKPPPHGPDPGADTPATGPGRGQGRRSWPGRPPDGRDCRPAWRDAGGGEPGRRPRRAAGRPRRRTQTSREPVVAACQRLDSGGRHGRDAGRGWRLVTAMADPTTGAARLAAVARRWPSPSP